MPKKKKGDEDTDEKREKRRAKREKFLESCVGLGLQYEVQDCKVYILYNIYPGHHIHCTPAHKEWVLPHLECLGDVFTSQQTLV